MSRVRNVFKLGRATVHGIPKLVRSEGLQRDWAYSVSIEPNKFIDFSFSPTHFCVTMSSNDRESHILSNTIVEVPLGGTSGRG